MRLTNEMARSYEENGYLFLEGQLPDEYTIQLRDEASSLLDTVAAGRVLEKDGHTVRSVYGCHKISAAFGRLVRSQVLLEPAQQLVCSPLYVYQFKINVKAAFGGDIWQWHQDFIFWLREDGMLEPRVTNAVVFLDDVSEINGPLYLIPGSHKEGVLPPASELHPNGRRQDVGWMPDVAADLKYSLSRETVAAMIQRYGVVAPKGPAGSVLFFHPNLAHGSANNMSPHDRKLALVTYNSTTNIPTFPRKRRPEFLVSSDSRPLELLEG
jgi:ectoine hydroxylase